MTKKKPVKRKALLIPVIILGSVIALIVAGILALPAIQQASYDAGTTYAQPVGKLVVGEDAELKTVATSYATVQAAENLKHFGNGTVDHFHCHLTMYGYDDKYIYAMESCDLDDGSGAYSVPTRYTYEKNPLVVTNSEGSGEGVRSSSIYPKEIDHSLYRIWIK